MATNELVVWHPPQVQNKQEKDVEVSGMGSAGMQGFVVALVCVCVCARMHPQMLCGSHPSYSRQPQATCALTDEATVVINGFCPFNGSAATMQVALNPQVRTA